MEMLEEDLVEMDDLNMGERLWIWRRREGMRSVELAKRWGVGEKVVTAWEAGERLDMPEVELEEPLHIGEQLSIVRRRQGWSIRLAALRMGTSHVTLIRWERGRGDYQRAIDFWREYHES